MARRGMDSEPMDDDRLSRASGLTPHTAVHVARARLAATGEVAAVVLHQGRAVGIVTADALMEPGTISHQDAPISTVMDYVAVHVAPGAGAHETMRAFTDAALYWIESHRSGDRSRRLC